MSSVHPAGCRCYLTSDQGPGRGHETALGQGLSNQLPQSCETLLDCFAEILRFALGSSQPGFQQLARSCSMECLLRAARIRRWFLVFSSSLRVMLASFSAGTMSSKRPYDGERCTASVKNRQRLWERVRRGRAAEPIFFNGNPFSRKAS